MVMKVLVAAALDGRAGRGRPSRTGPVGPEADVLPKIVGRQGRRSSEAAADQADFSFSPS
jgi:hypothetical protein